MPRRATAFPAMPSQPAVPPPSRRSPRAASRGFTLVEVLVALLVMSVVAGLAWQGIDGMVRARDASRRHLESTLRLGTVLAQWQQDLASVQDSGGIVPALRCDGAALWMTRRAPAGLQLVVWSLRGGRWQRWAPPVSAGSSELQEQWLRSQQLLGDEPAQVRMLDGVSEWQLYFWRGNAWTNCQSSGDLIPVTAPSVAAVPPAATAASSPSAEAAASAGTVAAPAIAIAAPPRQALADGVRLVLRFAPGADFAGTLTRDSLVAPQP